MSKKVGLIAVIASAIAIVISLVSFSLLLVNMNNNKKVETVKEDVQYVLYLGTNDKDTNTPVFSEDVAQEELKKILIKHFGGYTIQEAHGGWVDEGTTYQEYTLVIYLSDTTLDKVHLACKDMIEKFNQSSVLIQSNKTTTEFYSGN